MKTRTIRLPHPMLRPIAVGLAAMLVVAGVPQATAQTPIRISSAGFVGGKIMLNWTGNSYSYEVESTASLAAPNWARILSTARTNVVIPSSGNSGFYRVVDSKPNLTSLDLAMTNVTTGDAFSWSLQPQTNSDLVFNSSTNSNGAQLFQLVLPGTELQKFDMAFDDAGGFTIVTPDGERTACGGVMTAASGPGTNEITYRGWLTNLSSMVAFSAVTDPDPPLSIGDAAFSAVWCFVAWPLQALQCSAASASLSFTCALQGKKPFGIVVNRGGVTVTGTNIVGQCTSQCITGCTNF